MYQSDRLLTRKENLFEHILFLVTVYNHQLHPTMLVDDTKLLLTHKT